MSSGTACMRRVACLVMVAACATTPVKPPAALAPSDADVTRMSHDFMHAFDQGDVAAVKAMLGRHYVHYDDSVIDADKELAGLARWSEDPAGHVASRVWSDEHVYARATDAIFIGKAKEHQAGNDIHGGYDFEGWYTLGWSHEGDAWKLVYWSWKVAGSGGQTGVWNQIFDRGTGFNKQPNKLLAQVAATHKPGTAIDVASGQGRNSIYLAAQGWDVTGVDISDEGIRQLRNNATEKHLQVHAVVADVKTYDYGTEQWDLVAMIYAWPALGKLAELQRATKHGGLFVYEFFAPTPGDDDAPKPGELAKQFAGWEIVRDEIVDDVPDWRQDRAKIQRFVARKP
jgi:SAM-dependent methyltransferase